MTQSYSGDTHRPPPDFSAPGSKSGKRWILTATLVTAAVIVLTALVMFWMKDSEAGRLAVQSLQESSAAREALGEIRETGWPIGSISMEGGGSGNATLSMSVTGSKTSGDYYTTMIRENGRWRLVSARLALDDGRSIDIEGSAPAAEAEGQPRAARAATVAHGGRQLRSERPPGSQWQSVEWAERHVVFEVPSGWTQRSTDKRLLEFRPEDRSGYLTGNVAYFDQKIGFEPVVDMIVTKAAGELARKEILGYARRDLGKAQGVLQITDRGGRYPQAVWTGYFDTDEFGTASVTLTLGARTPADFDAIEPLLGAILDSMQVR